MAHYLPPPIMKFFQPRPDLVHKGLIPKNKMPDYMGIAGFVHRFNEELCAPSIKQETPQEKKEKRKKKRLERSAQRLERQIKKWNPREKDGETVTGDAYKTLFVARLNFEVGEDDLKDEFDYYGTITKCFIIANKKGKSRGYGFVEFESSRDLKEAYKDADGRKINGRRILVDVERGRTVKNWKPRRLGGGLGGTRIGSEEQNMKFSGREPPRTGPGSEQRGGAGGGRADRDRGARGGDRGGDRRGGDRGGSARERGGDRDRRAGGGGGDRDRRASRGGGDRDRERPRERDRERTRAARD